MRAALTLFEQGGWNALKPRARGKEAGNGRAMTPGQEQAIRDIICDKRPEQRKLDFALWNRGAVAILIECAWSLLCAARQKLPMISSVTNRGKARWMIIDGNFNADRLIEFMDALARDCGKKVFLILDNLRVHHCKPVKAWLKENKAKIEVFSLPDYSAQLNPDDRLNADLKYALGSTVAMRNKSALWHATVEYMTMLEQLPERVMSYFQDPRLRYAA